MELERRSFPLTNVEIRSNNDGRISFRGLAATYGSPSKNLGGFVETIQPTAFTRALKEGQDVPFLVNHDRNLFLGRTGTGTVKLRSEPGEGLWVEADDLPDTQAARDLQALGKEIRSMSFGFRVPKGGDSWDWQSSPAQRSLLDVDLGDVSVLTGATPAYNETTAEVRALVEQHQEDRDYTTAERVELAKSGQALPVKNDAGEIIDGRYPIANTADLDRAIKAFGRASDPAEVKAWIKKRAEALSATESLPDDWRSIRAVGDQAGTVEWDSEDGYADWQSDVQASLADVLPGACPWVCDISMDGTKALVCSWMDGGSKAWVVPLTVDDGDPKAAPFSEWVEVEQQYVAAARSIRSGLIQSALLGYQVEARAGAVLSAASKTKVSNAMSAMQEAHSHLEQLMADAGDGPLVADSSDTYDIEMASLDRRLRIASARCRDRVDTKSEQAEREPAA